MTSINGDNKSVVFFLSIEDIQQQIEVLAACYDTTIAVTTFVKQIEKKIETCTLLTGFTVKDSEELIGAKLSENLDQLIVSIGPLFQTILKNNYPIADHRNKNLAQRSAYYCQEDETEDDACRTIVPPDRSIINADILERNLYVSDQLKQEKWYKASTEASQARFLAAEKELHLQNSIEFNRVYKDQSEQYNRLVEKKNSAASLLRKLKKEKCSFCGFIPIDICQLDIDHIDGNRNNNDISNLQVLCANCHRFVHASLKRASTSSV